MDTQMTRAQGHHYDYDPLHHPTGVEAEEDHHEKTSILKKVKAKAKKVKNTIASKAHVGHGHGQAQDYEREPSQDDEDDEYDQDDQELARDPEVHGAPTAGNFAMGPDVNLARATAGPTPAPAPSPSENVCPGTFQAKVTDSSVPAASAYDSVAPWDSSLDHDANSGQFKGTLGEKYKHTNVGDTDVLKLRQEDISPIHAIKITDPVTTHEPASPKRHGAGQDENSGFFKGPLGVPLDESPRDDVHLNSHKRRHEDVSPANYQAKGPDYGGNVIGGHTGASPTNGVDVGVTPILQSFDKMAIYDEPQQQRNESVTTGSHDQFSPSPVPDTQFIPESFGSTTDQSHSQDMNVDQSNSQQGGYTSKVSSVASAIAGKAIAAKNAVASKVGYGGNGDSPASQDDVNMSGREQPKPQGTYTEKLSSTTTAIADKAASAKNVVASKLGYGGTDNAVVQGSEMNENVQSTGGDATVSGLEPPKPQGTYTEKLSSATAAIADKAASAKNVVASKLGYSGADDSAAHQRPDINKEGHTANEQAGGGVTGYGRQMASTVTEKLAPVYGTVAGAGSAVLSKIPGTGMGTQQKTGDSARETGTDSVRETDKGAGMKGYIAEKLKPSDEDKALSEVISGALHMRGNTVEAEKKDVVEAEGKKVGVHETVKDALHKRSTDEDIDREKMNVPMGKVTESEEVANRLGSSEEERTGKVIPGTANESPSTGVVDKVKGAFTNWFGKGGEMNPSMAFNDHNNQSQGSTGEEERDGERRLQAN